jgi:dolichyl-phosphate beta-glucosyltransferase
MQTGSSLSIVIPAYNEAARLSATLDNVLRYCTERAFQFEVIICDDGSTDATNTVVNNFLNNNHIRYLRSETNQGKGAAVRNGVLAAKYSYVLLCDADMSTPIGEIEKLLPLATETCVVIGSRAQQTSRLVRRQAFPRETMGKIFNLIIRLVLGFSLRDTQCGFKLFPAKVAQEVFRDLLAQRFAFDVEVLLKTLRMNLSCVEIGVEWTNSTPSTVHPLRDSLRMIIDVIRIRRRYGKVK